MIRSLSWVVAVLVTAMFTADVFASPAPAKPKVVCGMTIIPADPSIDPKFAVKPPDRATKYTMRAIDPAICKPAAR